MKLASLFLCVLCVYVGASELKKPTIVFSMIVRNKAHTLPYFLSTIERLNYPKERISLWIRSDHNSDRSIEILKVWVESVRKRYHSIHTEFDENETYFPDERGPAHWTKERFTHVINLKEAALNFARRKWADYLLSIDSDVFLTNEDTLNYLISKNFTIAAPMLKSDGLYSNFWYGMTEDYYYLRTDQYKPVVYRKTQGCFNVPMVHSCVLIDLRRQESDYLTYRPDNLKDFEGPTDDIITFAIGANSSNISLHICNEQNFGFITVPLEQDDPLSSDYENLKNIKVEVLSEEEPLPLHDLLKPYTSLPDKDKLDFDEIFMINLKRRPERRRRMLNVFDELGINATILDAVDGKSLDDDELQKITFLPNYADPYHKRPMTKGEIGCFLSHFHIWKEIIDKGYETTLVLEDDIRFEPFFRARVKSVMEELAKIPDWDLVYFGRKRLQEADEPWVEGSNLLVHAGYSYWTLGYVLSQKGAQKLLNADPLSRLVPVDEYLPILFDKHPQDAWKVHFPRRDLVAFSAAPLLLYPTHYTGDEGYISDTEDSVIVNEVKSTPRDDL
ncbi:glycosyltransferase 25 family member [Aethina tumida]|uniref:glycosyltransferase 25 family member n=1 Tax=Aethina tumida TaxID=116153 RepID=UPI0021473543|nr:glycosyltransferase 25 family member [Aethina tumida]